MIDPDSPPVRAPSTIRVTLPGPLDVPGSLDFFRRNGDDLIDRWDGTALVRVLPVAGRRRALAMRPAGTVAEPALSVTVETDDRVDDGALRRAVRGQFHTAHAALAELAAADPVVADLDTRHRGVRTVLQPDTLHALVRSISAQQVNLRWAATTRARLARAAGSPYRVAGHTAYALDADRLAGTSVAELRALQFSVRKAEYLVGVAAAVASGSLDGADLAAAGDEEVIRRLTALRGLGRWSAEWFLARTLSRPRVVTGDLGVRKAVGIAYGQPTVPDETETRTLAAHWGAAATAAQQLALEALNAPQSTRG